MTRLDDSVMTEFNDSRTSAWQTILRRFLRKEKTRKRLLIPTMTVTTGIKENKKYMAQTFKLKKGEILFENDKIIISDKAKTQRYMSLFTSGIWMLIVIKHLLKPGQSNADSLDYFWVFLGVINILLFVAYLLRSSKSIILVDEVKSLQVKQGLNNIFLDIKLNDHRLRRVSQIEDMKELEEYIKTHYGSFTTK